MSLTGRLVLSTTLLALLTTLLLGLGVRQAWQRSEERRFARQFDRATRELELKLKSQAGELREALEARCRSEPSVDSALIGLKAGDLPQRRLGLSLQIQALSKPLELDELVLVTSLGEVLGASHAVELVGQTSEPLRSLAFSQAKESQLRLNAPIAIQAACLHRDKTNPSLWVGLYAARHLNRFLESVAAPYGVSLSWGPRHEVVEQFSQTRVLTALSGVPVTASLSRQPLMEAIGELNLAIVLIAAMTLGVGCGVAFLLSRGIARPIEALSEQARLINFGDPKPVVAKGPKEIEALAHSFNHALSDLAEYRRRLAKAERLAAQREIANRVAHEIKNPLSPIRAAIETLRRLHHRGDPAFNDYFEEATRTVLTEVLRISRIVTEFTQFARLPEPDPTDVDLSELLESLSTLHGSEGAKLQLQIECHPKVKADRDQIIQVLTNLMKNAKEATSGREGAWVRVALKKQGDSAVMSVADNGPGLSPEVEARLFEPYVTSKPDGTGLGLAIAQRIVEEHGGRLSHQRPSSGGAEFVVELPLSPARAG